MHSVGEIRAILIESVVFRGQKIDPHDWKQANGKQVAASQIVENVLNQASEGNIILFHDGGGDRSQTVAALPQVIDGLRAEGESSRGSNNCARVGGDWSIRLNLFFFARRFSSWHRIRGGVRGSYPD